MPLILVLPLLKMHFKAKLITTVSADLCLSLNFMKQLNSYETSRS